MSKDPFELGMQMEKEGEAYYRKKAEIIKDIHAKKLLLFLAREEKRHYELIKALKQDLDGVMYTSFLKEVRTVFEQLKEKNQGFIEEKTSMMEILHMALEIEDNSIKIYKDEAEKTENMKLKELLLSLRKEEHAHYSLISSWIEYYDRPNLWLEQAEFTHLKEY